MTIRRQNKMRHSSSWPDRAPQKVKVRVDPLSRAFTIIPTSRETVYRLEQTAPRSNCLEEVILLDRCAPGGVTSVMIKRRLIDGRPSINKKPANFSENSSDVNNEPKSIKNTSQYSMPRSLSLNETAAHQNSVIVLEENIRDQSRCKSVSLVKVNEARTRDTKRSSIPRTTSDSDIRRLLSKNQHEEESKEASAQLKNKSPSLTETNAFDVIVNVANERQHTVSIAQTNNSQTREPDELRKKYQTIVSPISPARYASPPHINVMDYDAYVTSMSFSSKNDLHACPKCTSEGVLRSQIDPFRSPSQSKKNDDAVAAMNVRGVRRDNLIECEKREAHAEKHRSKNIWHENRLIGLARNGDKGDKKLEQLRNYDLSPARPAVDFRKEATLRRHYYPEGGWGYVIVTCSVLVHFIGVGLQLAAPGCWHITAERKFRHPPLHSAGWLGAMSTGVALLVSPITIAFCRKKSTRVTAVLGGLVTALGCLFTSFATQFHQLFFSYGTVVGIGVGMTRDCSTLMVAQYFKRKRELVEIFIVSGSGLGIAVMSAFIKGAITKIGWRLGLQAVTGVVFLTFILGTFYRSASLYHPQRRAILHLKNQKRKIKDKNKADKPPFFDFSTLKSKTVRILLISTGISAFGINTPIFYLAHQAEEEGLGDTVILLQTYLGLAWTLGCVAFGLLVVHRSVECRIARQYLTQAAVFVCGLCILALTAVQGNYHGYVMFAWIYGIFCGGYHYSLKMYTYERVRARNFAKTWGFVQCSQAIPIAIGVPISGYINVGCGGKAGYYFSSTCVLVGSFTLFFIDLHRRNLSRHKHTKTNGTKHTCSSDNCPQRRRMSFSQEPKNEGAHMAAAGAAGTTAAALVLGADIAPAQGEGIDVLGTDKPELTCISEEGIADMDLPDNLLEEFDYIGDCITSCNKVENYLMLSEFENNLIAEMPIIMDRRGRRWSVGRSKTSQSNCGQTSGVQSTTSEEEVKSKWRFTNVPPNANRMITVIDEASA
ncbi:uncharacterized protein LOC105838603 isoform X2 [Monomorium pharaonis]|uniref:uncharacterized protein LOC105838603 isoform X2 n=1 Tax=Monomorium pharaonis TaxID=307658 RepID=UPI001746E98B|nr:uncharacterized protein LOC105838603 isoform X2 [Monomorium pharaonis]